ncbi:hypothetical protein GCM10009604_04610 [Corynebacterium aurimucosum]
MGASITSSRPSKNTVAFEEARSFEEARFSLELQLTHGQDKTLEAKIGFN